MTAEASAPARHSSALARSPARWLAGLALLGLVIVPLGAPTYAINVLSEVLIYGIFAMSLDLLIGYTGLVSFGHAAFFGIGAYAAGVVATTLGPSLWFSLPAAVLAAGLLALLIGGLAIRSTGTYFLMLTLAFSQVVYAAAFKWTAVTGGSNGLAGVPRPTLGAGPSPFSAPPSFYYLTLVVFVISYVLLRGLVHSPLGHSFVGIRENEARMRAVGYHTWRYKLGAFVLAGLFAGVSGALFSYYNGFVSPSDVHWTMSGLVMVMVIIGGAGTLLGPVLGAGLVLVLQNVVSSSTERWPMIMGMVFIGFVLFARRGIAGLFERRTRRFSAGQSAADPA